MIVRDLVKMVGNSEEVYDLVKVNFFKVICLFIFYAFGYSKMQMVLVTISPLSI